MRSRRAISSVVGMVFAIIALTTTITYISYSMGVLNNYNQSVLTQNQQLTNVGMEKFQIASVTVPNNQLNVTVVNTGNLPINFTKIWIQNTTTTDWVRSYVPKNNFVSPGGVLTNIGQSIPVHINPANSYNVKLVTSRGNTQSFTVNSASTAKLNIQLMFLPPTVSSGFKTELVMVVINNSTGTLTNISPSALPNPTYGVGNSGNLQCNAGSVSPASYSTLAPGNAAFFIWSITTVGGNGGDTCTYNLTQPLQNGYSQNVSPPTPLTVTVVNIANTPYAQSAGLVTIAYTSFKWTESTVWNSDWSFTQGKTVDFSLQFQNNNQTEGPLGQQYYLWLSKNTQVFLQQTATNGNGNNAPTPFFIVSPNPPPTANPSSITRYNDFSQGVANGGGTGTVYFGAQSPGDDQQSGGLAGGTYYGVIVLYGKFTVNSGDHTGGSYAQTIPFMAVSTCGSPPC